MASARESSKGETWEHVSRPTLPWWEFCGQQSVAVVTPVVVTGADRQAYRQTTQETTDRQKERPAGRDSVERGQKENTLSNTYKSWTCSRDALWCDKKDLMVTIEKYIFIIITCVFLLQDNTNSGQIAINQPCLNDRLKWLFHAVVN